MTVNSSASFSGPYTADGIAAAFPFTFIAASPEEVAVIRLAASGAYIELAGYTVETDDTGGTVTFSIAPAVGDPIYVVSAPNFLQQTTFANQGNWPPTTMNLALDRAAIRDIVLQRQIDQAILAPVGEVPAFLPSAAVRAGMFLAFDADGDPIATPSVGGADTALRTDLAASGGPALIGANDGAGGSLFTTVSGFIAKLLSSAGSSIVGFIQAGTGAVFRSTQSKLRETVSVTDFGADPTGVADSLAAFNLAFATGKAVTMPEGSFMLSTWPTAPTGDGFLRGVSKPKTRLLISHTGARALHFTPASVNNQIELKDFTLVANANAGPCPLGIEIAYPSSSSYPYRQVEIDVDFRSDLAAVAPWAKTWGRAIRLTNVWYPSIKGNGSSAPIAGDTGNTGFLEITGGSYGCIGPNIEAVWYYGADFIRGSAYMEGIYVSNSEAVGVTRGVYIPATTANGGAAALYRAQSIFFSNSHIAAHTACFDFDNILDFRSVGGNIQRWADASATNWTGYKLNNVNYPVIVGGTIAGNDISGGVTTLGISATGSNSAHGVVTGVHFENLDTQFNLAAATSHWVIKSNVSTGTTPDAYTLAGTNHDVEWLDANGYVKRTVNGVAIGGLVYSAVAELGKVNAAGVTYTAAEFLSDVIERSGAAGVSDTTPTAAQIVAAIPGAIAGTGKRITINNVNSGVLTIVAGTGVTLVGTTTVTNAKARDFLIRITTAAAGSEAVRVIGLQQGDV